MIRLNQDSISEAQPVCAASAQMRGALIHQTPRRFSRGDNIRVRRRIASAAANNILQALRVRGDAAHALQQIQSNAFERKQPVAIAFEPHKSLAGFYGLAVGAGAFHREAEIREIPNGFFDSGKHARFIRDNLRDGIFFAGGKRDAGDVQRFTVGMQKFFGERTNHSEIFGICERQRVSAK